ncbi:chaperone modulator CbpM [Phaeobacter gallaeciensis]|uniref:chaperone modulator CbpM n=1 Tax=Phaeobacter gallaeciensis TaxID=60890 RepID=UPI00237EF7DA|nr:chaperone modulator CbpM [Phaeobacter gallaeciensis]MDE4142612.1 chaperone modulator CbpM [Phaeobacter gallaeciensis]MDE4151057.1 chaperone modulator CbpM [Phaeobacter gallaeciensis]MDE4155286.1 chaperone modulator CbpM [Phaeobacter gallaeciensis]MDE4230676.1 chaperone modulator CbpM [Phaeobacter gallaeciensis]MDE4259753.1 chaperone modulator CbpM [Phaeobacter gallaeciensis]
MTDKFSETEVFTRVTRLTRRQLEGFVEGELVRPEQDGTGYIFRRVDIARLELLCDLSHDLDLDETALSIVISLIDQLHAARQDLASIAQAIDNLPAELRARVQAAMKQP